MNQINIQEGEIVSTTPAWTIPKKCLNAIKEIDLFMVVPQKELSIRTFGSIFSPAPNSNVAIEFSPYSIYRASHEYSSCAKYLWVSFYAA